MKEYFKLLGNGEATLFPYSDWVSTNIVILLSFATVK